VPTHQVMSLFISVAAILVLANAFGALARRLGQPPVIGEIVAGVAVGPTLFHGDVAAALFPYEIRPFLATLANLGLAFFMFIVGSELEHAIVRDRRMLPASIAIASTALPFGLGAALAFYLARSHDTGSRLGFVLFLGAAMAVTAFPVLARILSDRDMRHTPVGSLALTSAALSDVLAWSLLAVAVTVSGGTGQWRTLLTPLFVAVMFWPVRPLLRWLAARHSATEESSRGLPAAVIVALLLCCVATEWLGIHFIFGAFLLGAVMPRAGLDDFRMRVARLLEPVAMVVLLPLFFVVAGLRVDLSRMGLAGLGELALILVVAIVGKVGGAYLAARVHRMPGREAAVLATLMNTRGLTELVILSVGLELGLIDEPVYAAMVVMAVVTTVMAGPILNLLQRRRAPAGDRAADVRPPRDPVVEAASRHDLQDVVRGTS
jgi:Kef-type K+ transport system membrane component KefB